MFLSIIGTRPQIIKVHPINLAFKNIDEPHEIVDTLQHYDKSVSEDLYDVFKFSPNYKLKIPKGSQVEQISKILVDLEKIIQKIKPNAVLVYGDTNSTLAASITAVKMQIPLVHIESGLRSFTKMQEEINRKAVDHISDYRFAPTEIAMNNLKDEGLIANSFNFGDVMLDSYEWLSEKSKKEKVNLKLPENFILLTLHRSENVDVENRLKDILFQISLISEAILLPIHHRLRKNLDKFKIKLPKNIIVCDPLNFQQMHSAIISCTSVITDSGGLQKEAFFAKKPCITLRESTEWTETLTNDWNVLCENLNDLHTYLSREIHSNNNQLYFGDGNASERIVFKIIELMKNV